MFIIFKKRVEVVAMRKVIIIMCIISAAVLVAAVVLGFALSGDNAHIYAPGTSETTGTAETVGSTSSVSDSQNPPQKTDCEHVYENGFCGLCGAEEPTAPEYLEFRVLDDGTYSVRGGTKIPDLPERLIIPDTYEGKPVTVIENVAFIGAKKLKYVCIPGSITEIGNQAFFECKNLEEVVLPESLKKIGKMAFSSCEALREITVKGDTPVFSENVFSGCTALKKAVIDCNLKCESYSLGYTFSECKSLETVEFRGKLIPNVDGNIGFYFTFKGCESLKSIVIPQEINYIGQESFFGCTSLESIDIPNGVKTIAPTAFTKCDNLYITASSGNINYEITEHRIVEKSTKTLVWQSDDAPIPDDGSITGIAKYAFAFNNTIREYTIPDAVYTVGESAFVQCENLKSIVIGENVQTIEANTFMGCKSLVSVTLPDGISSIRSGAFQNCVSLETFTVPKSVEMLSGNMLFACDKLKTIYIPYGVTMIENKAIANCPLLADIYYDGNMIEWQNIKKINIFGAVTVHCKDGYTTLTGK